MFARIFAYSRQSEVLIASIAASLIFSFFLFAISLVKELVIIALPALVFLSMIVCQYCFDIGHAAAMGKEKVPVYKYKSLQIQAFLFAAITAGLYFSLTASLGQLTGQLLLLLVLPAIMSSLIIEKDIFRALSPINFISFFWQLRFGYLLIMMNLSLLIAIYVFIPDVLWLWPKIFLIVYVTLVSFCTTGTILFKYRIPLKLQTPETEEEKNYRELQEADKQEFDKLSDHWHRLANVREITTAFNDINKYLDGHHDRHLATESVMKELCSWANTRLAVRFLPQFMDTIAENAKYGLIYSTYRQLVTTHGPIDIDNPEIRKVIRQFADDMDHDDILEYLS